MDENPKQDQADGKLSPAQIENWRRALLGMLGPIALILPVEQIQAFRDMMQKRADQEERKG